MTSLWSGAFVAVFAFLQLTLESKACLLGADWQPWNLTRRTQQADIVIVGNVRAYDPVFGTDDPTKAIFYTAQMDVNCLYGVGVDASDIAKKVYSNDAMLNVSGFNARLSDCAKSDIAVDKDYIVMVVRDWNGGVMRPDQINAQPSIFNATPTAIREFSGAMMDKGRDGYRLKPDGQCSIVENVVDVAALMGPEGGKTATRIPPNRVMAGNGPGGHGHRVASHPLLLSLSAFMLVLMILV